MNPTAKRTLYTLAGLVATAVGAYLTKNTELFTATLMSIGALLLGKELLPQSKPSGQ